jgi:transposase-like protein
VIGIPIVAIDLGLSESMLYSWRSKLRQTNQPRLGHFVMRVVQWGFSIFQTVENTFN